MSNSLKHGEILERAIKARGFSFASLAREIGISRRTIYNWIKENTLRPHVFLKVGRAIGYDFTNEVPDLLKTDKDNPAPTNKDLEWQQKYLELLEKYVTLLSVEDINKHRFN